MRKEDCRRDADDVSELLSIAIQRKRASQLDATWISMRCLCQRLRHRMSASFVALFVFKPVLYASFWLQSSPFVILRSRLVHHLQSTPSKLIRNPTGNPTDFHARQSLACQVSSKMLTRQSHSLKSGFVPMKPAQLRTRCGAGTCASALEVAGEFASQPAESESPKLGGSG